MYNPLEDYPPPDEMSHCAECGRAVTENNLLCWECVREYENEECYMCGGTGWVLPDYVDAHVQCIYCKRN